MIFFNKLISKFKKSYLIFKSFGIKMGLIDLFSNVIFRGKGVIGEKFERYKYNYIKIKLIENKYFDFKLLPLHPYECTDIGTNTYIWVFWWQGFTKAPEIVKCCTASIEAHKGNNKVIFLTEENLSQYVILPDYIYKKLETGQLCLAHFSDIVRCKLLYEYGGIWMDSTLFMSADLSNEISTSSFYTIHHGKYANSHVSMGKWSTFFLASSRGNILFDFLYKCLISYWKKESIAINYFLLDCFIAIAYDNVSYLKLMIDSVKLNNDNTFALSKIINDRYSSELISKKLGDTYLHKLSYKINITMDQTNVFHSFIAKY